MIAILFFIFAALNDIAAAKYSKASAESNPVHGMLYGAAIESLNWIGFYYFVEIDRSVSIPLACIMGSMLGSYLGIRKGRNK